MMHQNRRYMRGRQLAAQVLHHIAPYIDQRPERNAMREIARELEELFFCAGVQVITEADRAAAGLDPRDHNGLTLEEIRIMENRLLAAMLEPLAPLHVVNGGIRRDDAGE